MGDIFTKYTICEEDAYFTERVRYIHINPLRAGIQERLSQLDRHRWCGHAVVLARCKAARQDRDYALKWFGRTEGSAKRGYRALKKNELGLSLSETGGQLG